MEVLCSKYDVPRFIQRVLDGVHIKTVSQVSDVINLPDDYVPDFVYFGGGHDVTPALYGENYHPKTANHTNRDLLELFMFHKFKSNHEVKYFGICRGSQFLNVMSNGVLTQHLPDINGEHPYIHDVLIRDNTKLWKYIGDKKMIVNSTHHQASRFLGPNLIVTMTHKGIIEGFESIIGDKIRAVQSHPEYFDKEYENSLNVLQYLLRVEL